MAGSEVSNRQPLRSVTIAYSNLATLPFTRILCRGHRTRSALFVGLRDAARGTLKMPSVIVQKAIERKALRQLPRVQFERDFTRVVSAGASAFVCDATLDQDHGHKPSHCGSRQAHPPP